MKTSESTSNASWVPSLFQIAAFFEDFFPGRGCSPASVAASPSPIADLMINPEKLMALVRSMNTNAAIASPAPAKSQSSGKRASRITASKKAGSPTIAGAPTAMPDGFKKVGFTLAAPWAETVKLAGDFTEWENRAVLMRRSPDGVWCATVSLAPGQYSYRYIVNGQWHDDPGAEQHIPNPFGSKNSLIQVA